MASAGIIGTALALVLSDRLCPPRKPPMCFPPPSSNSTPRQDNALGVRAAVVCCIAFTFARYGLFYLSARYTLAVQFILLGLSLDALKSIYIRALDLLVPATALTMVSKECERYIRGTRKQIERILRVHQITTGDADSNAGVRYLAYQKSEILPGRIDWLDDTVGRVRSQGSCPPIICRP